MSKQVRASHILVKTEEQIKELRERILAGEKFEDLAAQYSDCPSGANGGDLGYFPEGVMVKEFNDLCFTMNKGDLSEPVKTQFGWHIIYLTDIME